MKTDASGKQKPQQMVVVDGVFTDQALSEVIGKIGRDFVMAKSLTPEEATGKCGEKGAAGAMEIYSRERLLQLSICCKREVEINRYLLTSAAISRPEARES